MSSRSLAYLLPLALLACNDAPPAPVGERLDGSVDMQGGMLDGQAEPEPEPSCESDDCELCNGLDDDGDGAIDEDVAMAGEPCGGGGCGMGRWTCIGGNLSCAGAVGAMPEVCNGADDDCDGRVDEEDPQIGQPCAACAGQYICAEGDLRCDQGAAEVCNGIDDDCDGVVDDNLTRPCGDETGACAAGVETCDNGVWGGCIGSVGPNGEVCNGVDDDCDGIIDERIADCNGLGTPCAGDGECSSGVCLDDDGSFYCSRECDPAAADDCGEGNLCLAIDGRMVCMPDWRPCADDCECSDGLACTPAANHPEVAYGCRPERQGGRPVGADCEVGAGQCATGTCLARTGRCVRWCDAPDQCGGGSVCDPGTVCAVVPGVEQPICTTACSADDDCPPYPGLGPNDPRELCRFRPNVEMTANVGICDWPNGDGEPLGGPCEGGGDCAHGLCWRPNNADNYCTKGCLTVDDCPMDWTCEPTMLNGLPVSICRQQPPDRR